MLDTLRYNVSPRESMLTFEARSTLHAVKGKVSEINGYIEAHWNEDGTLASDPQPKMHVDFPVEGLKSGNNLQDREMWKLVDSRRFPRVAADLRDIKPAASAGRYTASGEVTLAGRSRRYEGEFTLGQAGDRATLDGDLSLDIRDFGLKAPNLVLVKVAPVVKIHLRLVAMRSA